MDRKATSGLLGSVSTRGVSGRLRNRLALTTILTVVPFIGYGRQANAACDPTTSPTYVCTGFNAVTQTITVNNADVSTAPGFSVVTGGGDAIVITGDGHLRFTDNNASTIQGDANGITVHATGDAGGTPGAITILTDANIVAGQVGIYARNDGSGAVSITNNGSVDGQGLVHADGIYALNYGTNLTITTGVGSTTKGADEGIDAVNQGSGNLTITANGNVEGANDGILAYNSTNGANLSVTVGAQSIVTAGASGVYADNQGSGALGVTINGQVDADTGDGVYARNYGTNLTVTTGVGSLVSGGDEGIDAVNQGSGNLLVNANGGVYGDNDGILAYNSSNGVDLTVTTGAQSFVTGGDSGIDADNQGSGNLSITAHGKVYGYFVDGIHAVNSSNGGDLTVTTGADSHVYGYENGIFANNQGSGDLDITANGNVIGQYENGIVAINTNNGGNLSITTAAGKYVYGYNNGINANHQGSGSLVIEANGDVTGYKYDGIRAFTSSNGVNLEITTGANSYVFGGEHGISASSQGSGDVDVTANGSVIGSSYDGINAFNSSNGVNLKITTGANSYVYGYQNGINATNQGSGSLVIEANGGVTGYGNDGIVAFNSANGENLKITAGANSDVYGFQNGINASNQGKGDLDIKAYGEVIGYRGDGIAAFNSANGDNLRITTGTNYVYGFQNGINASNQGKGDLDITANGEVVGYDYDGIRAFNSANGVNLKITTGADSYVYGYESGINATNQGKGDLDIRANGEVIGYRDFGIRSFNSANGVNLKITAGANSYVYGYQSGIDATNQGKGYLYVRAYGEVIGYRSDGIAAFNSANGDNLKITTGANSYVFGYQNGINASNQGKGDLDIKANGEVIGDDYDGIRAFNSSNGVNLKITTGASSYVYGYENGINAINQGKGDLDIIANGEVLTYGFDGINAVNYGINLKITTGAGSYFHGGEYGINANNQGTGDVDIKANGEVSASVYDAIRAFNSSNGVNLKITTGAGSYVHGNDNGINVNNQGTGDVVIAANGEVVGSTYDGINAFNSVNGANLKVTTGAGSDVYGYQNGINVRNFGSGDLTIIANGLVTGQDYAGIATANFGAGVTDIRIGATGVAQGDDAGIYAFSDNGQVISITNDGVVRNSSGNSYDRAINIRGGATTIYNNNLILGDVGLSALGDTFNNAGTWNSSDGSSDFGDGDDVVTNSGTVVATGLTFINALETFNNPGLITMVDGLQADDLHIGHGTQFVGQGGTLAVDALLAPVGESDELIIDGDTSGVTNIVVNLVNPLGSEPNFIGIPVVEVTGTTQQGDFVPEGGVINAGFFAWDVQLLPDNHTHVLITTGLGAGAFEFAAGITGAQDLWYQTTGSLLERQADLRALLAGTQVTPVADFSEPVEPTPVGRVTPGLWLKGVGGYIERDQDVANNAVTDRNQEIYGIFGGFDFGSESAGEAWLFGVFGGYVTSDLDFKSTNTEWDYEGPSVGAYATYLNEAFHADVTVKADFLDVDIDASNIAPADDNVDSDVFNLGGRIDAGYKMPIGNNLFIDPQATLAVLHTEVDDIGDVMGGSVDFEDETSVRGRLGLRLGHEMTGSDQVIYSSDVTASVWQGFTGDNDVTVAAPLTDPTDVSDDPGETYGDVALGFSVQSPEGWSSFLRANYQFSDDYDAFAGNAGVRYAW